MNFKIEDRVLISKNSEYYTDWENNPKDIPGTITLIRNITSRETHNIKVMWDNGCSNVYRLEDLIHTEIKYIEDD